MQHFNQVLRAQIISAFKQVRSGKSNAMKMEAADREDDCKLEASEGTSGERRAKLDALQNMDAEVILENGCLLHELALTLSKEHGADNGTLPEIFQAYRHEDSIR